MIVVGLCDHMELMTAFATKTGRVEAIARCIRIFELTLEQDPSGALSQGRENIACA